MQQITSQMTLDKVMELDPLAIQVLLDSGMSCVGCSVAHMETLAEGAIIHGLDPDELVAILNAQLKELSENQKEDKK